MEFGRFKSARAFDGSEQSFVVVPYNPAMESPRAFTVEAWVYLNGLSAQELAFFTAAQNASGERFRTNLRAVMLL